jgi:hypothetical protein
VHVHEYVCGDLLVHVHGPYSSTGAGASAVSSTGTSPMPRCASQRYASGAAMQPVPAAVTAWR